MSAGAAAAEPPLSPEGEDGALLALLGALARRGYRFVTPTPLTHHCVLARAELHRARDLRDVFGWSLPFEAGVVPAEILGLMRAGGVLEEGPHGMSSAVRVSNLAGSLFLHSAFPTAAQDSVFFGPDSYRFADLIAAELRGGPCPAELVDVGAGAGVGAIAAGLLFPQARLVLTDTNPKALRLARINAAHAGLQVETIETDGLEGAPGPWDLVLANPPYILDRGGRTYRDGGDMHGGRVSLDWAMAAAARLKPGGRLLLYTGSAIVAGEDPLRQALETALRDAGCKLDYRELDPDVFGEELERPDYAGVDRIAVVAAVATKRR